MPLSMPVDIFQKALMRPIFIFYGPKSPYQAPTTPAIGISIPVVYVAVSLKR